MPQPKALIIGYGFTGQSIDRALNEAGFETIGVRRDWSDKESQNLNSEPLEANITKPETLKNLPENCDIVVNCVSAGARGDTQRYQEVYREGSKNLLEWLENQSNELVIWTGSSSVYGDREGDWVDEESDLQPESDAAEILVETENLYRQAAGDNDVPTLIFRVSGIYGPGRARTLRKFQKGNVNLSLDEAHYYMNMIHRTDIGRAVAKVAENPIAGETYNIVDNKPVTKRKFYVWLSQKLDHPLPKITGGGLPDYKNKRVSNQKFRSEFDFEFHYPTYREGYETILRDN